MRGGVFLLAAGLATVALVTKPGAGALAACNGAFLAAATIEECLDQPPPPADHAGGGFRGIDLNADRNLKVTHAGGPAAAPAAINLWVTFAFDSAQLSTDTRITLDELARALRGPRLGGKNFVLAGHTDAVGTAGYNQTLSERRAKAVRDYLAGPGQVPAQRLKAEGWGFSRPLNTADPAAAENRRVEVRVAE